MVPMNLVRKILFPILLCVTGMTTFFPGTDSLAVRSTSRRFASLPEIHLFSKTGESYQSINVEGTSTPGFTMPSPQAVHHHHHNNQNGFVRVSESEYDHVHHTLGKHAHQETLQTPHLAASNGSSNLTTSQRVFLSKTATLDCKVYDVNEEPVSWMRQVGEMLLLLSYDKNVYAMDERYTLHHESGLGWKRWKLIIVDVIAEDKGLYRCLVGTKPSLVLDVMLNVTEPRTRIVDERGSDVNEKHYNSGSMIELKCLVDRIPSSNDPVVWKNKDMMLSFNTSRGGISEKRDKATGVITNRLYVVRASPRDSGIYSCWYGNLSSAVVTVHVIIGENSAAMQHDSVADGTSGSISTFSHMISFVLVSMIGIFWQKNAAVLFWCPSKPSYGTSCSRWQIYSVKR